MHHKQDEGRSRLRGKAELYGKRRDLSGVGQQLATQKPRLHGQLLLGLYGGLDGNERPWPVHVSQLLSKSAGKTETSLVLYDSYEALVAVL